MLSEQMHGIVRVIVGLFCLAAVTCLYLYRAKKSVKAKRILIEYMKLICFGMACLIVMCLILIFLSN